MNRVKVCWKMSSTVFPKLVLLDILGILWFSWAACGRLWRWFWRDSALQFFHLALLSLLHLWLSWSCGVCVYFWIQWFFPLFEADNFQHIPKFTGDFGVIVVKGQKVGEMAHNFQFGSLRLDIPERVYRLLCLWVWNRTMLIAGLAVSVW